MDKFKTKAGRLTPYALACGYIEEKETAAARVQLWGDSGIYHVKAFDYQERKRVCWECFHTLAKARRFYDAQARQLFKGAQV